MAKKNIFFSHYRFEDELVFDCLVKGGGALKPRVNPHTNATFYEGMWLKRNYLIIKFNNFLITSIRVNTSQCVQCSWGGTAFPSGQQKHNKEQQRHQCELFSLPFNCRIQDNWREWHPKLVSIFRIIYNIYNFFLNNLHLKVWQ